MRFQKKPVVIEAWQFTDENKNTLLHDLQELNMRIRPDFYEEKPVMIIPTLEGDHRASIGDFIIKGVHGELYPCKPDIFEKTYEAAESSSGMNFGRAIEAAKQGKKIRRAGWNGKNQYIELATAISYKNPEGVAVNVEHDAIGNKAFAFVGTSGVQMGWLASQADMLADDWEVMT